MNGVQLKDTLKYGIVDLRAGSKADNVTVRISKPLLRIIVEECQLFEELLNNGEAIILAEVLPAKVALAGNHISGLLATCRPYSPEAQEAATLMSWLVTLYSWLTTKVKRPPAKLHALRPGALVFGNKGAAAAAVSALERAARAVDEAGLRDAASEVTVRHQEAVRWMPKLVARDTVDPKPGQACFMPTNTFGVDTIVRLAMPPTDPEGAVCDGGALLGQQKGVQSGPSAGLPGNDNVLTPGEAIAFLQMMTLVAQHGVERAKAVHGEKSEEDLPDMAPVGNVLACELLTVRKASPTLKATLVKKLAGEQHCLMVITGDELGTALGPVFGGIVARGALQESEEASGEARMAAP